MSSRDSLGRSFFRPSVRRSDWCSKRRTMMNARPQKRFSSLVWLGFLAFVSFFPFFGALELYRHQQAQPTGRQRQEAKETKQNEPTEDKHVDDKANGLSRLNYNTTQAHTRTKQEQQQSLSDRLLSTTTTTSLSNPSIHNSSSCSCQAHTHIHRVTGTLNSHHESSSFCLVGHVGQPRLCSADAATAFLFPKHGQQWCQ